MAVTLGSKPRAIVNPTYPCSCTVTTSKLIKRGEEETALVLKITYCPMHQAAPELFRQLVALAYQIEHSKALVLPPNVGKAIRSARGDE